MSRGLAHPLRSTMREENRLFTAENPAEPRDPAKTRLGWTLRLLLGRAAAMDDFTFGRAQGESRGKS